MKQLTTTQRHHQPRHQTIGFISLGCSKNLVDSERIMSQLICEGYSIVEDYKEANLIIINTCGFINDAIDESLDTIEHALNHHGKVIVTGCLGKRKETILNRFPEVLHISGPDNHVALYQAIHQQCPAPHIPHFDLIPEHGIKLTPSHYAYLKISEGCNQKCSYCIIPELRGPLKSRPLDSIMNEATQLKQAGVKELLVVSQDTAAYGLDSSEKNGFIDLTHKLAELDLWVRLHYLYPYPHIDSLLPLMTTHKILPYLDIPLQHADSRILKLMQRPAHTEKMLDRIHRWRDSCPEITIRSTFMVGFPGETDKEFETLLEFLEAAQLDRVGCFKYSPVAGAKANALPDQVPAAIKETRLEILMNLQSDISYAKLENKIGNRLNVLIDVVNDEYTIARTMGDSPEVDGEVIIEGKTDLQPGEFVNVEIISTDEHDLVGLLIK